MTHPERPPSLPEGAVYDADGAFWQLAEQNERGERHGTVTTFSADGRLRTRGTYENGKPDGFFSRFTDGGAGAEPLRTCCVPPGAREHRVRYRQGRWLDEVFYDERGRPLCEDGTPWPERAPTIPEHAYYVPSASSFVEHVDGGETRATVRYFSLEGALLHEFDTDSGRGRGRRRFGPDGVCVESTELDDNGNNHGLFMERFAGTESPYADPRVREVRGRHEHGERVGRWQLIDANGEPLSHVEYGDAWGDTPPASVTGSDDDEKHAADERWWAAQALWEAKLSREALACAARALAADGNIRRFETFVSERALVRRPEHALSYAQAAEEAGASAASLLGALLGGADTATVLCALASSVPSAAPAGLDYAEAAVLLRPDRERSRAGRALLRIEHGDRDGALEDARFLADQTGATATLLRDLCRVSFPSFSNLPEQDPVTAPADELVAVEATQPLAAVQRAVALYATRLERVRHELLRRIPSAPSWLPPDLGALLPQGPIELERRTVSIADEGENGVEVSEVDVDETLELGRSTRALLAVARGDWAALSWLCWTCGLEQVGLPEALVPRPLFPAAVHRVTLRCWRAHDRLRSSGLIALARQVEGFDWEGMRIDAVPPELAELAASEYLSVRAMFFWLLFPENTSPFQADLRKV